MCLIFDVKLMEESLREMDVDLKKMPLGALSKTQIQAGYEVLSEIQDVLQPADASQDESDSESKSKSKSKGKGKGKGKGNTTKAKVGAKGAAAKAEQQLSDLSNRFYTIVPHDFGLGKMKIISSIEDLRAKIKMIEALLDIEATVTMLSAVVDEDDCQQEQTQKRAKTDHERQTPVDQHYAQLRCRLTPLEPETETYKLLQRYVDVGKAPAGLASYLPRILYMQHMHRDWHANSTYKCL